jgi:hypothetical protein
MEFELNQILFHHPFTCMLAGPTSSGKTVLVRRILSNYKLLIDINVETLNVMWAYGQWQNLYNSKIPNVNCRYIEGLPNENEILENKPDVVVIDDLMTELGSNKKLTNLFTKGSHHLNISIIFISQNLFHQGSQMRTISLNCHYTILMKNPRDKAQIQYLASQIFPGKTKYFLEAYADATSVGYGYIVIDLTQNTPEILRVRSRITPEETPKSINSIIAPIIYTPK